MSSTGHERERKLLAILAADVVGYSRMMEADEAGTITRLNSVRAGIIDPAVARHHGRIVKLMGDGALVVFPSVVDAVTCAVETQHAMAAHNLPCPAEQRIVLRMGVNLGDVVLLDDDVYGDGVNVAARLEQLCEPGGLTISGTAYDHLQGKVDLDFQSMGEQQVKNLSRPIRVYRLGTAGRAARPSIRRMPRKAIVTGVAAGLAAVLVLAAGWWWTRPVAAPVADKPSIAVLPFDDYSADAATGRLADGLTEDIVTDLARFPEFDVIARNSTEQYKDKAVDVRDVATALNVRYVLEGSIQHQADRIRITAQLVDAGSGSHVWSQRWDRGDEDLFTVQSEIAQQVTMTLGSGSQVIRQAERDRARRKAPGSLTAYEYYLLGDEKLVNPTPANLADCVDLMKKALALDPQLARAWITLFHAYDVQVFSGTGTADSRKLAAEAAERAVALDPADAAAHMALGSSYGNTGDVVRAKGEFDAAMRLWPGSADVLTTYASWAATFGDAKRGAELADQAIRLNPDHSPWAAGRFAYAYFAADRYEDALRALERAAPDNYPPDVWIVHAGSLAMLGKVDEAKRWTSETLKRYPGFTAEGWANEPGYSDGERQRFLKAMVLAGFPPCAPADVLIKIEKPVRLPECTRSG
jgi:TolB-like protein/class 3 adenylate cyclase/Flp pilus assembly protein TadD